MTSKDNKTRRAESRQSQQHDGLKNGTPLSKAHTEDQYTADEGRDPDRTEKALRWLAYGRAWRAENPSAWAAFEEYADQCVKEGKLLSGNALHAIVKRRDYTNVRTGKTATLNRYVLPLFVRWLLSEHACLRAELRGSFFDALFAERCDDE